jgi:hypothetical protein
MPRQNIYDQSLSTVGRFSVDPVDSETIERLSKKGIKEGEERLLFAILTNAIEDFQKHVATKDETGRKLFQEAEEWFLDQNSDSLCSFSSICETLGLHPDYIRRGLMSWKETKRKDMAIKTRRANLARARIGRTSVRLFKTG